MLRIFVEAVAAVALLWIGANMSALKDAADAVAQAITDLTTAAEAVLAAFQNGTPADQQAALDELAASTAAAKAETAKLQAAVPPPPAP